MAILISVGGNTFEFPSNNQNPGWGKAVSDWAKKISEVVNNISGPNDIVLSSVFVQNNISSPLPISGCIFNTAEVKSLIIEYFVTRTTTTPNAVFSESGKIKAIYTGSGFNFTVEREGNAGIDFDFQSNGQVIYYTSNLPGATHVGEFLYTAKTIDEV